MDAENLQATMFANSHFTVIRAAYKLSVTTALDVPAETDCSARNTKSAFDQNWLFAHYEIFGFGLVDFEFHVTVT